MHHLKFIISTCCAFLLATGGHAQLGSLTLLSHYPVPQTNPEKNLDIWGYEDPYTTTEYALMGSTDPGLQILT